MGSSNQRYECRAHTTQTPPTRPGLILHSAIHSISTLSTISTQYLHSIYTPRVRLDNTTAHRQLFTSFVRGLGMCEAHPLLRWGRCVVWWWGIQRIQCGYTASCSQHFVMLLDNWHSWAAGAGCRGYCGQVRGSCGWWQVVLMGNNQIQPARNFC